MLPDHLACSLCAAAAKIIYKQPQTHQSAACVSRSSRGRRNPIRVWGGKYYIKHYLEDSVIESPGIYSKWPLKIFFLEVHSFSSDVIPPSWVKLPAKLKHLLAEEAAYSHFPDQCPEQFFFLSNLALRKACFSLKGQLDQRQFMSLIPKWEAYFTLKAHDSTSDLSPRPHPVDQGKKICPHLLSSLLV